MQRGDSFIPMKHKLILKKSQKIALLCLLPFAAAGLLLLLKQAYAAWVMPWMPPCLIRTATGLRCPSCGMTHSVFALCRLDLAGSLRANALILFGVLLLVLLYAECWTRVLGRPKKQIPRKKGFWIGVLIAALAYAAARNLPAFAGII